MHEIHETIESTATCCGSKQGRFCVSHDGGCKPRMARMTRTRAQPGGPVHGACPTTPRLSRNDSVGSVVLARSAGANPSSFARYGPRTGPRRAHSSACTSICFAITSLPTESSWLSRNDSVGSVVLARSAGANPSSFARYGPRIGRRPAHSSACGSICFAIACLPTASLRMRALGAETGPDSTLRTRLHRTVLFGCPAWTELTQKPQKTGVLAPP